jgi:hypothetical protein
MKIKDSWRSGQDVEEIGIPQMMKAIVQNETSERGHLEDLEARLAKLTEMFGALVQHLGEPAAKAVIREAGYRYEVVE